MTCSFHENEDIICIKKVAWSGGDSGGGVYNPSCLEVDDVEAQKFFCYDEKVRGQGVSFS